ncbi:MAG: hypothetical protein O9341_20650, partial [Paucibacter sp.]|nr:hypothetical protein [Roseateles sp.]
FEQFEQPSLRGQLWSGVAKFGWFRTGRTSFAEETPDGSHAFRDEGAKVHSGICVAVIRPSDWIDPMFPKADIRQWRGMQPIVVKVPPQIG